MTLIKSRRLAAIAAAAALLSSVAFAEPIFPKGGGVGLEPPPGMAVSKSFAGFGSVRRGASILIVEFPAAAREAMAAQFTPSGLLRTGFVAREPAEDLPLAGGRMAKMMRGRQSARGTDYRKWVVLAETPDGVAMVTAQVPETALDAFPDARIEAALRSIAFQAPRGAEDRAATLPFRMGQRAGFRLVTTIAGSGAIFTEGPKDRDEDGAQPVLVVGSSLAQVPAPSERAAFAEKAFRGNAREAEIETQSLRGGMSVIEGRGLDPVRGDPIYVMQLIRFSGSRYVRVIGISRAADRDRYRTRFLEAARSVRTR